MRVISGRFGGIRLHGPKGWNVRPTTDRVKESMFAPLHFDLQGASVLDLFGGTGALGLEAASRGAVRVVIVEKAPPAQQTIRSNWIACGSPAEVEIMAMPWRRALETLRGGEPFDLVFLDPPYAEGLYKPALEALAELKLLADGALLVLESDKSIIVDLPAYEKIRERRYGHVFVTWLRSTV